MSAQTQPQTTLKGVVMNKKMSAQQRYNKPVSSSKSKKRKAQKKAPPTRLAGLKARISLNLVWLDRLTTICQIVDFTKDYGGPLVDIISSVF
jgi:hypothetical protein